MYRDELEDHNSFMSTKTVAVAAGCFWGLLLLSLLIHIFLF